MTRPVIWFAQSAHDINSHPGYVPITDGVTDVSITSKYHVGLIDRLARGELVPAEELPSEFGLAKGMRGGRLTRPIFYNSYTMVRRDVAEVMERFDLGATILKPVVIHLDAGPFSREGGGTNEDYRLLACANVRPTIDDARSEPIPLAVVKCSSLTTEGEPGAIVK